MQDAAIMTWGRIAGGAEGAAGTYLNLRTMAYYQTGSDAVLPLSGWWHFLSTDNTKTASQIATIVNTALGTAYTSANFHSYTSADLAAYPGTGAQDA